MRTHGIRSVIVAAPMVGLCWLMLGLPVLQAAQAQGGAQAPVNDHRATKKQLEGWMKTLSNWGRWGEDDQLGTLNLITPEKRREAAALVRAGRTVSLAHDIASPFALQMRIRPDQTESGAVATDRQDIDYHGGTFTHLDALCHVAYGGQVYNGRSFDETVTQAGGCAAVGVDTMKEGVVTRGILVDIPRLKGVPYLEPGTHIYPQDIEAWERQAQVRVSPGDAILIRTGRWAAQARLGATVPRAGLDASVVPFLKERDVALIISDWTQDVGAVPGFLRPIHRFAMVALGAPLVDNADLDQVAEVAASLNRWSFMVVLAPPRVLRATGSPINPIAVF